MGMQLFTNNALSQLSGSLSVGGTTLVCSAGHGSRFPTPTGSDFFYLTLFTKDIYTVEQNIEIVKVTARAGDVMTIERDIEGITGNVGGFSYNGSVDTVYLEMRWTAGCVANVLQLGDIGVEVPALVHTHDYEPADAGIQAHLLATNNPHTVTKAQVGLSNVDNTSDANKPVSTAQATALGLKLDASAAYVHPANHAASVITQDASNRFVTDAEKIDWNAKQNALVSGTSIKTINSASLLGSGDIVAGDVTLTGTQTLTNKTLTAPVLGTPASGNLSNCTADGTDSVGFLLIPQNSKSADYTLVLADSGKHIHKEGTTAFTTTIPANSSVAFPIGTALTFVNSGASGAMTIAITTDTMRLAGTGTTGSRTLAAYGVATAIKVTSTLWMISGSALT